MKLKNKKQVDNGILLFAGIAALGFALQIVKLLRYTTKAEFVALTGLAVAGVVSIGAYKTCYACPSSKSNKTKPMAPPALAYTSKAKNTHQPCATAQPATASKIKMMASIHHRRHQIHR